MHLLKSSRGPHVSLLSILNQLLERVKREIVVHELPYVIEILIKVGVGATAQIEEMIQIIHIAVICRRVTGRLLRVYGSRGDSFQTQAIKARGIVEACQVHGHIMAAWLHLCIAVGRVKGECGAGERIVRSWGVGWRLVCSWRGHWRSGGGNRCHRGRSLRNLSADQRRRLMRESTGWWSWLCCWLWRRALPLGSLDRVERDSGRRRRVASAHAHVWEGGYRLGLGSLWVGPILHGRRG